MGEKSREEFLKKWIDIFEDNCKPGAGQSSTYRTIIESEVIQIGEHLFKWFKECRPEVSAECLARIMVDTHRRYKSFQDWAVGIIQEIEKGKQNNFFK